MNPYMLFAQQKRAELKSTSKDVPFKELVKQMAKIWKDMNPDQKKIYEESYKKSAESFRSEEQRWWQSLTALQQAAYNDAKSRKREKREKRRHKSELKQLGKPQRPVSGFNFFIAARKDERKDMSVKEYLKYLAQTWNNMKDADKMPYQQISARDKERYDKEMVVWENKMIEMGHTDLVRKSVQDTSSKRKNSKQVSEE
jgi:hypothetical protein